ncbi:MAG: hypothetical protein KJO06_12235 [Gemmatimonadetes bacterium]|nr:hypothetical protein [Gemmatimonadota bacterium]
MSTWLVWIHFSLLSRPDAGTACNLGGYFNCDAVNASGFATQLDVPVAYIGLLFYLFLGVLGTAGLLCGSRPRTLAYSRGLGAVSVLTPTFIIGKRMVTGARSRADLAALIREELAAARGVGS